MILSSLLASTTSLIHGGELMVLLKPEQTVAVELTARFNRRGLKFQYRESFTLESLASTEVNIVDIFIEKANYEFKKDYYNE